MSNINILNTAPGNSLTDIKFTTFSDGSETCTIGKLFEAPKVNEITTLDILVVQVTIEDATRDLLRICLVKDALDRMLIQEYGDRPRIYLSMQYMPQARADRQFGRGQPHPLAVFSKILNSLEFDEVHITDPHSDVTEALVNNIQLTNQSFVLRVNKYYINRIMKDFQLCAPDLGAAKKMFDVATSNGYGEYIQAIKIRDVLTGDIVKCDVIGEVTAKSVLIVDDISDGGASFKFLAMKLKEKGVETVGLLVTHGIFPGSLIDMHPAVDYIFVHNIVGTYLTRKSIDSYNSESYMLKNR